MQWKWISEGGPQGREDYKKVEIPRLKELWKWNKLLRK